MKNIIPDDALEYIINGEKDENDTAISAENDNNKSNDNNNDNSISFVKIDQLVKKQSVHS